MTSPPKIRTELANPADQTFSGSKCGTKEHSSEKINAGSRNVMFLERVSSFTIYSRPDFQVKLSVANRRGFEVVVNICALEIAKSAGRTCSREVLIHDQNR